MTNNNKDIVLPVDAFIRSIAINNRIAHSIFLGAGASISSGMPSAFHCIWDWKYNLFISNNPSLKQEVSEISLESVKRRIQKWLDIQGIYPKENSPEEYSQYIQACYPLSTDRRQYFNKYVTTSSPSIGYKLICLLATEDLVPSVWTTNFDNLTSKAATLSNLTAIEIGIDSQMRVYRPQQKGEIVCVSLHGDYRYDSLKNTSEELVKQENVLFEAANKQFENNPLIVIGYSGRDSSVMNALRLGYSKKGAGALYWCGHGELGLTEAVAGLIRLARASGRQAFYIPTNGFDDLLINLAQVLLPQEKLESLETELRSTESVAHVRKPFRLQLYPTVNVVKSNAFEIRVPDKLVQFNITGLPDKGVWKFLRDLTKNTNVIAAPLRGKILAFGLIADIKAVFGNRITGSMELVPLEKHELSFEDGVITSMLCRLILVSASDINNLYNDDKRCLWEKTPYEIRDIGNTKLNIHRAIVVYLRVLNGSTFVVLKPSLKILNNEGAEVDREIEKNIKIQIFGYQHNNKFEEQVKYWAGILCGKEYSFPSTSNDESFVIGIGKSPLFAQIGQNNARFPLQIKESFKKHMKQSGQLLDDVPVIFSNIAGDGVVRDIHPLRGLLNNRPSDYPLTQSRIADTINIGVICPTSDSVKLECFLFSLLQSSQLKDEKKEDYLLAYPGFQKAYGVSLVLPNKDTSNWICPTEPDINTSQREGLLGLANSLIKSAERIALVTSSPVVIIFIPQRWQPWFDYEDDSQHIDLHNYVKASCAQKGIATQFLRWATLENLDYARVKWWLSLAIYAKSMRTPWRLDCLENDTAYVGLGYSIDKLAQNGQHILMGCSHLYSSRGEGLQFRLNKIENPIYRNKKPFLSEDDARKVGENIRQLFFEAKMKLPKRVVIHKRTPFIESEKVGFAKGLKGIDNIDLIEISIDESTRYVASKFKKDTGFEIDTYPINRGTVIPIDDYSALLWVHGSSIHVANDRFKYYKGKRRIPAPLIIRRHAGSSDLATICTEILGLSKMSWNSFDLYAQLPATIDSSNEIAKIGSLLARFSSQSYDYRLFI